MRRGRLAAGLVVVLVVVALVVVATRGDDPTDPTGAPLGDVTPSSQCASEKPALEGSVWGIAVDKGQHTNSVAGDWPRIARSAHPPSFAYIKASEGERDPVDVNHWAQRDTEQAREVGVVVGFVHWAVPGEPRGRTVEQDALAEARHAVRSMGGSLRGTLPPVLGLGLNPQKLSPDDMTTWARTWLEEVERLVQRPPVVLVSSRFLTRSLTPDPELAHYPLWLQGAGCVPAPWADWTFRTARSPGLAGLPLPRLVFVTEPAALVYSGSKQELQDLAASGTGIGSGPAHAHDHRWR